MMIHLIAYLTLVIFHIVIWTMTTAFEYYYLFVIFSAVILILLGKSIFKKP